MSIKLSELVDLVGGEIVGKVRLQKLVYLLDQVGLKSGLSFTYHYYGPYSDDLSTLADMESLFGDLQEVAKKRVSDGVPYSTFKLKKPLENKPEFIGEMGIKDIKKRTDIMEKYSSTELEIAATVHWLINVEAVKDWEDELEKRKGIKTKNGRKERALELLRLLGLN